MEDIVVYFLRSVLCSALFAGYYWLFLRNRRMHAFNRFYLLSAVAASILLPLLRFQWNLALPQPVTVYPLLDIVQSNADEDVRITGGFTNVGFREVLLALYAFVSACMVAMLVARVVWLYRMKKKYGATNCNGYKLIYSNLEKAPFSFLNLLFWKNSIDISSSEGSRILKHELTHISQKHTLDKLFIQSTLVVFWANPFLWLLRKELSLVHEFAADEAAVEDRDTETFARMLLQEYCGNSYAGIVHPFFHSSTKRRLFMLNQPFKTRMAGMRRFMAMPLLATAVLLFAFKVNEAPVIKAKKRITLALDGGHGGIDNGAVGINNVKEKDLVLKITTRLAQMGDAYNINVVQVRQGDEYVKLDDRVRKANATGGDVMVSVHVNKRDASLQRQQGDFDGFDIKIEKRSSKYDESRALGSAIASKLASIQVRSRLVEQGLVVLRNANMPAVLIECGYVDNPRDVARINNDEELDKLCHNILGGIAMYYNGTK